MESSRCVVERLYSFNNAVEIIRVLRGLTKSRYVNYILRMYQSNLKEYGRHHFLKIKSKERSAHLQQAVEKNGG